MVKSARHSGGTGLNYLFACFLKFICFVSLFFEMRGPERNPKEGPEGGGGGAGGVHVLSAHIKKRC